MKNILIILVLASLIVAIVSLLVILSCHDEENFDMEDTNRIYG